MAIDVNTLADAVVRANGSMTGLTDILNAADAKLGDGDTGTMLARLIGTFAEVDLRNAPDLGDGFKALATTGAASTGSSLGTLIITAMMVSAKQTAGQQAMAWSALGPMLATIRDAAMARGKAELGAKTIIDGLDALTSAVEGLDDPVAIGVAACNAMDDVLAAFRQRPSAMGRARMFGDKSIGLDDPGMLALAEIVRAAAADHDAPSA